MAFGDFGGPVTSLIITCRAADNNGTVAIKKGDALKLVDNYTVTNVLADGDAVFGEALEDCAEAGAALAVRVGGICTFSFTGDGFGPDGFSGVVGSSEAGKVRPGTERNARGLIVRTRNSIKSLEVLL